MPTEENKKLCPQCNAELSMGSDGDYTCKYCSISTKNSAAANTNASSFSPGKNNYKWARIFGLLTIACIILSITIFTTTGYLANEVSVVADICLLLCIVMAMLGYIRSKKSSAK